MDSTATFTELRQAARRLQRWLLPLAWLAVVGAAQAAGDPGAESSAAAVPAGAQAAASAPAAGAAAPKPYGSGYEARGLAAPGSPPLAASDAGSAEARARPQRLGDRLSGSPGRGGGAGRGGRR